MHTLASRGLALGLMGLLSCAPARGWAQQAPASSEPASANAPAPVEAVAPEAAPTAEPATAEPATAEPATAEPATAEPTAADLEPAAQELVVPESSPVQALSRAGAEQQQRSELRTRLRDLEQEQADTSTVLPWTLLIAGAAAAALGAGIGIERVVSCEGSCSGEWWPGWMVLTGMTVGTAGLLWLKLVEEDLSELRSRHYHLQTQVDALELSSTPGSSQAAALRGPMLQWRGSF